MISRLLYGCYVIFLLFLSLKIVGNYLFFQQAGHLTYANAGTTNNPAAVNAGRPIDVGGVLHPYFGYVQRPEPFVTKFGFLFTRGPDGVPCCEIPYIPKPNEIIVAVLGGSVPEQLAPYFGCE